MLENSSRIFRNFSFSDCDTVGFMEISSSIFSKFQFLGHKLEWFNFAKYREISLTDFWKTRPYFSWFGHRIKMSCIEMNDGCGRRNVPVKTLGSWWRFWLFKSPTSNVSVNWVGEKYSKDVTDIQRQSQTSKNYQQHIITNNHVADSNVNSNSVRFCYKAFLGIFWNLNWYVWKILNSQFKIILT